MAADGCSYWGKEGGLVAAALNAVCAPAGEEMKPGAPQAELPTGAGDATIARLDKLRNSSGSLSTAEIRGNMQRTMQVC